MHVIRLTRNTKIAGVIMIVVLMAGSFLLGSRWGGGHASKSSSSPTTSTTGANYSPQPMPPGSWTGASTVINGFPFGWKNTEQGAVQMAASTCPYFIRCGGSPVDLVQGDAGRLGYLDQGAKNGDLGHAVDNDWLQFNKTTHASDLHNQGINIVFSSAVLAYHVDSFGGPTTTLRLWTVTYLGIDHHQEVRQTWRTITFRLIWGPSLQLHTSDWQIIDLQQRDGPMPRPTQTDVGEGIELPPDLGQFRPYAYDPNDHVQG